MSCYVEQREFAGHLVPIFFCGEDAPPAPPCQFCESPSLYLCDWITDKQVPAPTMLAEVGDVWVTHEARKRARIVEIENLDTKGEITEEEFISRRFWVLIPGHPKPYPYLRNNGASYTTERPGTCDKPACEFHVREVAEEKHWCKEHWSAWELVS